MANPNDIAKIINEMMRTLQELSDAQLESVSSIVDEQVKLNDNRKILKSKERLEKAKETRKKNKEKKEQLALEKIKESERDKVSAIVKATSKFVDSKIKNISKISKDVILSEKNVSRYNTLKKINNDPLAYLKDKSKEYIKSKMSARQIDMVRTGREINQDPFKFISKKINLALASRSKPEKLQSQEDFTKEDVTNYDEEQVKLLKSIDEKIDKMTSPSGGGIFDFLVNALPKIISSMAGLAGGGLLGAGALGGLGKVGKWFKFPKIASAGGKILTKVKDPKVAIPLVLGSLAVAGVGFGINKLMGGEEEQGLEGRAKGGSTLQGKSYVVGENGPEIFTPKENGTIIPNHKIGVHKQNAPQTDNKFLNKLKLLFKDSNDDLKRNSKKAMPGYIKPFTKTVKMFSTKLMDNVVEFKEDFLKGTVDLFTSFKDYIIKMLPSWVKDAPKAIIGFTKKAAESVSNFAKNSFNALKDMVTDKPKELAPTSKLKLESPVAQQKKLLDVSINNKIEAPKIDLKIPKPQATAYKPTINFQNIGYSPTQPLAPKASGEYNVKKTQMFSIHQNEMVIPKAQAEMIRSAVELKNDYNISQPKEYVSEQVDESFWVNKFVPAFAKAIKVDRSKRKIMHNVIANPFGA